MNSTSDKPCSAPVGLGDIRTEFTVKSNVERPKCFSGPVRNKSLCFELLPCNSGFCVANLKKHSVCLMKRIMESLFLKSAASRGFNKGVCKLV